jgi:hypothetical protein
MVYALGTKSEHGFIVNVDMLDGNPAAIRSIDEEPDGGVAFKGFTSGRRCHVDKGFPTKMRWLGPLNPPIPDFNQSTLLNVSERAKAFIESIEPGVHQFVPVDYVDKQDRFVETRYFWVICNRIDSVDREHTTFILRKGKMWCSVSDIAEDEPELLPAGVDPKTPNRLVYNSTQIGGAQVWRDKHFGGGFIQTSNRFAHALQQSGLTGFQLSDELEAV